MFHAGTDRQLQYPVIEDEEPCDTTEGYLAGDLGGKQSFEASLLDSRTR